MKTSQQEKFERLISAMILSHPGSKVASYIAFILESDLYYDIFCEKIYEFSEGSEQVLFIDEKGVAHLCNENKDLTSSWICLLSDNDYQTGVEDIVTYINIALFNFEKKLLQLQDVAR